MSTSHFESVIALAKRRGFIIPSSEIYGGMANTYDYGPLGAELLRQVRNHWWDFFVSSRDNIYGLETSVLMNPKVWEASGHTSSFTDALVDCKNCHQRTRADHLIENYLLSQQSEVKVEGQSLDQLHKLIQKYQIKCPNCGSYSWTQPREFNLLFETSVGIVPENQAKTYLRGETAQGMFVDFKAILDTMSPKLPFGLAQSGKAFRNEITLGQSIFRTLEFDLAEFEYYIHEKDWESTFTYWQAEMMKFSLSLGIKPSHLRWRAHTANELSHYSKRTEDLEYQFPFGFKEWYAVAYRTDFDLKNHMEKSGKDLRFTDPYTGDKFIPHVIEPTFGLSRTVLVLLTEAYHQETGDKPRTILKFHPRFAPYQVAVFPLLKNKPDLVGKAREVYDSLKTNFRTTFDDRGNIGKRYYSQDEIGTPFCVTIDFDTLKDQTVTLRHRDTGQQERLSLDKLAASISDSIGKS